MRKAHGQEFNSVGYSPVGMHRHLPCSKSLDEPCEIVTDSVRSISFVVRQVRMCFGHTVIGHPFDEFLIASGRDASLGNKRFVARNFLLDQGVDPVRQDCYRASGVMVDHADLTAWGNHHVAYLLAKVRLPKPDQALGVIDQNDHAKCPETFRQSATLRLSGSVDEWLHFIRVVDAKPVADCAGIPLDEMLALAQEVVQQNLPNWTGTTKAVPPTDEKTREFEAMLETWDRFVDLRPVWAIFWEDVKAIFGNSPTDDISGWPDRLRDWGGLYHFDPVGRVRGLPLLVFRYAVGDLPRLKGERDLRPLAVPTVLDGRFSEAFCPSPKGQATGHVEGLIADDDILRREILHPALPFHAKNLFRVGIVSRPLPADLTAVRRRHLEKLRYTISEDYFTYGEDTDGDLWPT